MSRLAEEMVFPEEAPPAGAALPIVKVAWASPLDKVRSIVIKDQADLTAADMIRQDILADIRAIDDAFDPQIAQANNLHKSLLAKKKEFTGPRLLALDALKPKIAAYIEEQDRIRLQAEREVELKRQEAKILADKAVDKAWALVDKGQPEKADAVLRIAAFKAGEIESAAPTVPEKAQANVSLRELWDFEVVDAKEIPLQYLIPDLVTIGKIVRATKDQTNIPGIRVIKRTVVADKGSRK